MRPETPRYQQPRDKWDTSCPPTEGKKPKHTPTYCPSEEDSPARPGLLGSPSENRELPGSGQAAGEGCLHTGRRGTARFHLQQQAPRAQASGRVQGMCQEASEREEEGVSREGRRQQCLRGGAAGSDPREACPWGLKDRPKQDHREVRAGVGARGSKDPMKRVWDGAHPRGRKAALVLGGAMTQGPSYFFPVPHPAALLPRSSGCTPRLPSAKVQAHTQFLSGMMPAWRTMGSWGCTAAASEHSETGMCSKLHPCAAPREHLSRPPVRPSGSRLLAGR